MRENIIKTLQTNDENVTTWYSESVNNIKQAIAPYGYFKPKISSSLHYANKKWIAVFNINKGNPVIIHKINISLQGAGKFNTELQSLLNPDGLKVGEILNTSEYDKVKSHLLDTAINQGYIKAYWKYNNINIDLEHNTATIKLILDTKKRYYVGAVNFQQTKSVYSPAFLQRFTLSAPKGIFSSNQLIEYQQQLTNSQYFRNVSISADTASDNVNIPVNINVTPPPGEKYVAGLGYSTWTGPRLLAGANFRNLNDQGHYLETQLKLSPIISGASAKYFIPGNNPLTEKWVLEMNMMRFLPKNGSSSSISSSGAYHFKNETLDVNLAINYLLEKFKVDDKSNETSNLLYPSLNVSQTVMDNSIFPMQGYNINFVLKGSSQYLLSTTSFLQGELSAKYIFPVFKNTRFIARGDIGYTLVHDINELPISLRFFTGGANSIRGYKDSSIGPGKYLMDASVEIQQKIYGDWMLAAFADQGKAADHFNAPWNKSVGGGVIYISPIGPVKVYVARDISLDKKPYRLEFSFGPEF
jgi:translocation and assembly module TamA